jgi:hypothetical protein
MNRIFQWLLGIGCLGFGCGLLGWALGVSADQTPRGAAQGMLGTPLPDGVQPEVAFSGLLGPIVTRSEYMARVQFEMPVENLGDFVDRLGCPYPSADNRYECVLIYPQGPGGRPPAPGTAESRLIQFRFLNEHRVRLQMRLSAT